MGHMGKSQRLPLRLPPHLEARFPNLKNSYKVTSSDTGRYNCIAFAAGDESLYWDPAMLPAPGYYWPPRAQRGIKLSALESAFATLNYEPCTGGQYEPGYEKVALYCDSNGDWTHAARQRGDGFWESKLGISYDIRHETPHSVSGPEYGTVWCYMRRKK